MIAKVTRTALDEVIESPDVDAGTSASDASRRSVLTVLWRRRWTVILTLLLCVAGASLYLLKATRIYTGTSRVYVEQQGKKILSDNQTFVYRSESFLPTQTQIIRSAPILKAALEKVDYRRMKTFSDVDNPVTWLQAGSNFRVEVGKKDDVITVQLDSPFPEEAAEVVNSIVDSYVQWQTEHAITNGTEMMKVLNKEKKERQDELTNNLSALTKFRQDNGAITLRDSEKGNIIMERLSTLQQTMTTAELDTFDLRAQTTLAELIVKDPRLTQNYVEAQQNKERDGGDRQLDDLRSTLQQREVTYAQVSAVNGADSQKVRTLGAEITALHAMVAAKEKRMAEAHLADLTHQVQIAEKKEAEIRTALDAQREEANKYSSKLAELARLEAEADRTQKQCDLLDTRYKEIGVNTSDNGALTVQVLEAAKREDRPSKPRKTLTLGASLLLGLLLGAGLALARDFLDQRFHSVEDVSGTLGLPILGVVPHIRGRHDPVSRGQMVHLENMSDVAEAYRTVRTAVFFGAPQDVKTIMVTSPAPGDGKSTTASNMAIAMAQAGHRTILLDADLRKPVQHRAFQLGEEIGMSSVIAGATKLRDAIRPTPVNNLYVIPVGPIPSNPAEIMTGRRFAQVIEALCKAFDRVVIDTPPVMSVADSRIIAASADVSILVVRTNKSTRKLSSMALDSLRNVGANVLGVIVNDMPRNMEGYGYYSGYKYYGTYGTYGASRRGAPALTNGEADETTLAVPEQSGLLSEETLTLNG